MYEWNDAKNARNIRERGLDFALAKTFDWDTALIIEDTRQDYGEPRWRAMGKIGNKLYALVYTLRGDTIRIISLRRANSREEAFYEETQET